MIDLGENATCEICKERFCMCPERDNKGNWKSKMIKKCDCVKCPKCDKGYLLQFTKPNFVKMVNGIGYVYTKHFGDKIYYECSVCKHKVESE